MPRIANAATHRLWHQRLERFARSGLSIAAFCRREGVSQPSFYSWRRRLGEGSPRFLPVRVVPPATAPVELLLPSGCVLRLSPGCELLRCRLVPVPDLCGVTWLKALIEAKLAGQPVATLAPDRAILPLLEALQQSVAAENGHAATPATKTKAPRKRARRTA